jgi:AcrR family transcriptional regulator
MKETRFFNVSDLCKFIGISRGTFYRWFETKRELWNAIVKGLK